MVGGQPTQQKISFMQSRKLRSKLSKLKEVNGSLLLKERQKDQERERQTMLMVSMSGGSRQTQFRQQRSMSHDQDGFHQSESSDTQSQSNQNVNHKSHSQNDLMKMRTPDRNTRKSQIGKTATLLMMNQDRASENFQSVLIPQTDIVKKLNATFSSIDEIELNRFFKDRRTLDKSERSYLQKYILKGLPHSIRGKFWMDLARTFANDSFYTSKENQDSIERILQAYVRRNPTIGYCQGMNFIVGRLRKYLKEEVQYSIQMNYQQETFWLFCMIIECYLPFDYFEMMIGVLIDQKVFMKMVEAQFKDLFNKFKDLGFDFAILAFQWFLCIFTYNMPEDTALSIIDVFLLKGSKTLFQVGITLIQLIESQIIACEDIGDLFQIFEPTNAVFTQKKKIIEKVLNTKLTNKFIKAQRAKFTDEALNEIKEYETSKNKNQNQSNNKQQMLQQFKTQKNVDDHLKLRFLQKFPLFQSPNKMKSTVSECDENQREFFHCDHVNWPRCIFDYTASSILPQQFSFRVKHDPSIINDYYFYPQYTKQSQDLFASTQSIFSQFSNGYAVVNDSIYNQLIIERNYHPCSNKQFKYKFIDLYNKVCYELLTSPLLNTQLCSDIQAKQRLKQFMEYVLNYQEPLNVVPEDANEDLDGANNSINSTGFKKKIGSSSNNLLSGDRGLLSNLSEDGRISMQSSHSKLNQRSPEQLVESDGEDSDDSYFMMMQDQTNQQPKDELVQWLSRFDLTEVHRATYDFTGSDQYKSLSKLMQKDKSSKIGSIKFNSNFMQTEQSSSTKHFEFGSQKINDDISKRSQSHNLMNLVSHYQRQLRQNQKKSGMIDSKGSVIVPRQDNRTSVGAMINQRSIHAFITKHNPENLNEKQTTLMRMSSIIAFNNNFL
ncbi:tbc domain-containing protein [Stylonychia lemnae]|uniref:Tbc domain-containing protein n=1 Tax=Stylonychia lemnae TaxID=5949 RepID=A0A078A0V0_STYLE|nr:tbc domain-containing protein [Stylonychia lemnae]|eukprot:CDW75098.1 tbc domain-containing protein [Stylonychia lemnae]